MLDGKLDQPDLNWVLLAALVIFLMEVASGQLRGVTRREFGLTVLCFLGSSATTRPLAAAGFAWMAMTLFPAQAGLLSDIPLWQSFPIVFVAMEFSFYWIHRWSHEGQKLGSPLGWLWKIHRTHHSAGHINVSVTQRQNIFWAFFTPHVWMLTLAIYFGLEGGAVLYIAVMYFWNLFTHMHWPFDKNWLRNPVYRAIQHVVVTPAMHHSHHGYGKNGKMYRNYALCLSVFDWMFGTLYLPDDRPSLYGVPGENPHWTEEVFYPLNRLAPKKRSRVSG